MEVFLPWKTHLKIEKDVCDKFLNAYKSCDGDYKKLRSVIYEDDKVSWDIVRNKHLKELLQRVDDEGLEMWNDDELPSEVHTELILWAYSPEASRIKKQLSVLEKNLACYKDDSDNERSDKKLKRKHDENSNSSDSAEESSKKKK